MMMMMIDFDYHWLLCQRLGSSDCSAAGCCQPGLNCDAWLLLLHGPFFVPLLASRDAHSDVNFNGVEGTNILCKSDRDFERFHHSNQTYPHLISLERSYECYCSKRPTKKDELVTKNFLSDCVMVNLRNRWTFKPSLFLSLFRIYLLKKFFN